VIVVHGFNTHGYDSVIRWAAMLYANGYDVLAADQRDFFFENQDGFGYPSWQQTFGWKESEDVLAAGRYLAAQTGVRGKLGIVGFSEGGQNTVLTLALDRGKVFGAGLQFSGPLDSDARQLLVAALHLPGHRRARRARRAAPGRRLRRARVRRDAVRHGRVWDPRARGRDARADAQTRVTVPLLSFYSADDSLVPSFEAQMLADYEGGNSLQATYEVSRGEHAYFFDRWWQQRAILLYFKELLPAARDTASVTADATVNQTAGGLPFGDQLVPLAPPSRVHGDAQLAPYVCDTTRGIPGLSG
jgi:dienelactone hydrolase